MMVDPQRWLTIPLVVVALCLAPSCQRDQAKKPKLEEQRFEFTDVEDEPRYPPIDPASVTPLEVVMLPDPVGKGYRRVPIRMSKSLHSGKWLGFASGEQTFMGTKHIIVNHFRRRPDRLGEGYLDKNVLLDVETGEVVAEYDRGRHVQASFGLAIVYQKDDERPYLLDVTSGGKFVLALPEGEHEYVYQENYWLRFSPIAKRVWITARDAEGTVHLYAWDQLDAPPELPNNPFPFMPKDWDPMDSMYRQLGDTEEVEAPPGHNGCQRAILEPPKGWVCVEDDEELDESWPLSEGWRLYEDYTQVFNRLDGRGYDLAPLCPEEFPMLASIRRRSPPQLRMRCQGDDSSWMLWTPPDRVRRLDPQYPPRIHKDLSLFYDSALDRVELSKYQPSGVIAALNPEQLVEEVVGTDYDCPDLGFRSGNQAVSGIACKKDLGRALWFELYSRQRSVRSRRFQATELAVSSAGLAVAIVRRGDRDHVVRLSLGGD